MSTVLESEGLPSMPALTRLVLHASQRWMLLWLMLASALHAGCFRQEPLHWTREPKELSTLLELQAGEDVVVTFVKAAKPDVTLRFERLEWPFLVGSVARRGDEPGERRFEPTRIDLNEVARLERVRVDVAWTATVLVGAVAGFAFAVMIAISQASWGP
jgi:hypothetical protein